MSVRPNGTFEIHQHRTAGSLFGAAIEVPAGGFWQRLAVSPPRTPPRHGSEYEPLPPEFHLQPMAASIPTTSQMDSVFPSWLHRFDDAVLVTFSQEPDAIVLNASPKLECVNLVQPTKVSADGANWRPLLCEVAGMTGHLFSLTRGDQTTCRIEATVSGEEIVRIVIVQPEYSALSVAANMVPSSTLLVFDNIRGHIDSLNALKVTLEGCGDTGYVPTEEFVTTSAFDELVLTTDHSSAAYAARNHWKRVKNLMKELSSSTADCIDVYNYSELKRVGHSSRDVALWRNCV
tara:strand:+ start:232 stop:1101 length:870 start_codon:yes stop_codon:yes gene_type:complete